MELWPFRSSNAEGLNLLQNYKMPEFAFVLGIDFKCLQPSSS